MRRRAREASVTVLKRDSRRSNIFSPLQRESENRALEQKAERKVGDRPDSFLFNFVSKLAQDVAAQLHADFLSVRVVVQVLHANPRTDIRCQQSEESAESRGGPYVVALCCGMLLDIFVVRHDLNNAVPEGIQHKTRSGEPRT